MKLPNKRLLLTALSALLLLPAVAQDKSKNVLDLKYSIEDSNIVFPESYETDTQKLMERWYLNNYTSTNLEATSSTDPGATDDQIRERLAALPTIIDMPFNSIVRQYIERYTKKGRKQLTALLGLSTYYMPIFEQALEESGLPLELKYLPVIESGLNPNAVSKHGAAGLWQFILQSAKGYDMEVSSLVDERRDPYISSKKACQLLSDLYNTYDDWSLAIAAYNCGPGAVNKALKRAGGDASQHDFWSIYYYLPAETRGYVPMFIAANYVMNYYPEHDIAPALATKPLITDTVHICDRVHFNQISAVLDIPVEEIRILNPQFRADVIPATASRQYNLILPSQQIHAYLVSEDQILAYDREKYARRTTATPGGEPEDGAEIEEIDGEPLNPADPAPVEIAAAEIVYEETYPVETQPATPSRRRTTAPSQGTQQTTTSPALRKTDNTSPALRKQEASTTPKKTETTTAKKTETTTAKKTETATTTKKASNTAATTKKTETTAKKSAAASNTATASKNNGKKKETADTSNGKKNNKKAEQTAAAGKEKKNDTKQKAAPKPVEHSVSSGENLTTIAKKHGVSVEQLKKANPKLKGDMIHPGDKLSVPSKSAAKTDTKAAASTKKDTKASANTKDKSKTNTKNNSSASTNTTKKGKKK